MSHDVVASQPCGRMTCGFLGRELQAEFYSLKTLECRYYFKIILAQVCVLAHEAFVRTNRRAIAMMFVRLSVRL